MMPKTNKNKKQIEKDKNVHKFIINNYMAKYSISVNENLKNKK